MFPTTEDAAINARLDPKILHAMTRGDVVDGRRMSAWVADKAREAQCESREAAHNDWIART